MQYSKVLIRNLLTVSISQQTSIWFFKAFKKLFEYRYLSIMWPHVTTQPPVYFWGSRLHFFKLRNAQKFENIKKIDFSSLLQLDLGCFPNQFYGQNFWVRSSPSVKILHDIVHKDRRSEKNFQGQFGPIRITCIK